MLERTAIATTYQQRFSCAARGGQVANPPLPPLITPGVVSNGSFLPHSYSFHAGSHDLAHNTPRRPSGLAPPFPELGRESVSLPPAPYHESASPLPGPCHESVCPHLV